MKPLMLFLCSLGVVLTAVGQSKPVHFKKLQEFLPVVALEGMERKKPTGETQTAMGVATSEASVRYTTIVPPMEEGKEPPPDMVYINIEVKISDVIGIPYGSMAMMAYQQDFENETEEGFERSVTVLKKYKGKETGQSGDSKQCGLEFGVVNRFVVTLEATGTDDLKLLYKLVENMNLAGLEKTST